MRQTFRRDADSSLTTVCHRREVVELRKDNHEYGSLSLPSSVSRAVVFCQNFLPLAHKSAIYGEGSGPKRQPEGPKSAISEKELVIFELRKVLFSEKHLRELPGACYNVALIKSFLPPSIQPQLSSTSLGCSLFE